MAAPNDTTPASVTRALSAVGADRRMRGYRLRIQEPGEAERSVAISVPSIRAGAHPENDVVLRDDAVSRIHFEIVADPAGFRVRDLDSTNGTWVDRTRVVDAYASDGARIVVGATSLVFEPLDQDIHLLAAKRDRFGSLLGKSAMMREMFALMERAAASDATVLVHGESGTGKELIAQALHDESTRRGGPFVVFDCSAVPATLVESELFGHEKGAFTGADARRVGFLGEADGGTLFLDEIGELPLEIQPKLLRALEQKEFRPVGSTTRTKVDVRFIAATHRNLGREVNRGTFREDLYYRLAVLKIDAPPLRQRPEDIPMLVEHMIDQATGGDTARARKLFDSIPNDEWTRLKNSRWRGNVRQLRNVVERALALSSPGQLDHFDISNGSMSDSRSTSGPSRPASSSSEPARLGVDLDRGFQEQKRSLVERFERSYLTAILARHAGNFSRAADAAGLDRMYFKRLLKKYE